MGNITLDLFRYDEAVDSEPHRECVEIDFPETATVLDALEYAKAEVDGSISTFQFDGAVFKMASAGQWRGDASVRQRLDFFASRRQRVS